MLLQQLFYTILVWSKHKNDKIDSCQITKVKLGYDSSTQSLKFQCFWVHLMILYMKNNENEVLVETFLHFHQTSPVATTKKTLHSTFLILKEKIGRYRWISRSIIKLGAVMNQVMGDST